MTTNYPKAGRETTREFRNLCRLHAGAASCVPVVVVPGDSAPQELGRRGYHTTPSGKTVVNHPNAYGYRTWYHCSTLRVEVGQDWLMAPYDNDNH